MAHTDVPIACHETIREDDSWEGAHQCRGAAIFRANVAKSPRDPAIETGPENHERVFSTNAEFKAYHERRELTEDERAAAERRRNA